MKYPYCSFDAKFSSGTKRKKTIWRPVIDVVLIYGKKLVGYPVLIDSGADYNIFHSEIADVLSIKLKSGNKREIYGLGSQSLKGYEHKVKLRMIGLKTIATKAIFTKNLPEYAFGVLGNDGFFNHFKVSFNYKKKAIFIE